MKKIISLIVAVAMVMSMAVCAFAYDIPSTYGTESTVDTSSDAWIQAYSADTSWQDAWAMVIKDDGIQNVYQGAITQDYLNNLVVSEIEKGNVSKNTINGALQQISDFVDEQSWATKPKGEAYKTALAALAEAVANANEPEVTTQPSGGGEGGSGGGSSTDKYTAEEYGKKIVDMLAEGKGVSDIASTVVSDLMGGKIDPATIPDVITYVTENADTSDSDVSGVLDFLEGLADQIGGGESIIPGGGDGDISLPDLGGLGDLFSNFDISSIGSLLSGIPLIGPLIAGLFGGGDDDGGNGGGSNSGDNTWDDGGTDDFSNNDTGDVSFIAVGTVALVAGAALILTRKRNKEEEE